MTELRRKTCAKNINMRSLRLSLKYQPKVLKLIITLRQNIRRKSKLIKDLKHRLKDLENKSTPEDDTKPYNLTTKSEDDKKSNEIKQKVECNNQSTQTDEQNNTEENKQAPTPAPDPKKENAGWDISDKNTESITDQVKQVAHEALNQFGMVYVESAGMYYDCKTGYYYNSELGLYYHTDTQCYYYYSEESKSFVFHSYPDRSATNTALEAHQKSKAKKHKMARKTEDDIDNLTKNLSQVSLRGKSALETVAKHYPPCMRVIIRETSVPKLRVGSLYIVTKDGGTVGREGEEHAILLKDHNVSRNHLDIRFDTARNLYMATDLGSKNGTVLNGSRMSESQITSTPMEIVHGSVLQIGETKLLCHIHAGNDTCGHCEPGLIMEATEKEKKVAYTRTCNVQKQHQLELARLKNKYAPKPLAIEETAYNDRAQARRETVGSSHHSEKTQSADINVSITPENKGFKLLEKMGWNKGEGLGKDSQGETEPVPLVSNDGTAGLGANRTTATTVTNTLGPATMRLASRTKMLKPPAKAFLNVLGNDDESE